MGMASIKEQSQSHSYSSRKQDHYHRNHHLLTTAAAASDSFNLREWSLKARMISRENTNSRRFSASNIRRSSFRELESTGSFRSNFTISSTASSPGYPLLREEIDPSTYSFTNALKALQARNVWECLSPDGFALNSKWNEAEKYICNPLSGEFPMECLSTKTLSGRSFRNLTNTLTMSAPLVFSSSTSHYHSRNITQQSYNNKSSAAASFPDHDHHFPISVKKKEHESGGSSTRDVGTQSTPYNLSHSHSPSPASTPSIAEPSLKRCDEAADEGDGDGDSPNSIAKPKTEEEVGVKETRGKEETKRDADDNNGDQKKKSYMYSGSRQAAGCLSWMRRRQREKHKQRKRYHLFPRLRGC